MRRRCLASIVVQFALLSAVPAPPAFADVGTPTSLTVHVDQARLDRIMRQVREHRWRKDRYLKPWELGVDPRWFEELGKYWATSYDWRKAEARINRFKNYLVEIDGAKLHYVIEKGSGRAPPPLLLLHGWPYSFYTFLDVIEPLAHPERFGGRIEDAFDVVVIDAPGHGFSEATKVPESSRAVGRRYQKLMTDVLGYRHYIVQGGDQGAITASWMAHDFPRSVRGHLVHMLFPRQAEAPFLGGTVGSDPTPRETAWVEREKGTPFTDLAYILTHMTRPETLALAVQDNPVGQAAWLVDKWYYWSDKHRRAFDQIFSRTRLLDELMVYIATDSFGSSMTQYIMIPRENIVTLAAGEKIGNPAGVTAWPDPVFPLPPKEFVERSRSHLIYYATPDEGGHFPSVETPEAFVRDVREFRHALERFERLQK